MLPEGGVGRLGESMRTSVLALVATLAAVPAVVEAQEYQTNALLQSAYALWGMMDGAANFCWEVADYDVRYMEAHQNWLARNVIIRDELDAVLSGLNEAPSFVADSEGFGSNGILEILRMATNPEEACGNWLSATDVGTYEPENFLAMQLGQLRERDGM